MREDTPPLELQEDDLLQHDEMIYIGDLTDEVIEELDEEDIEDDEGELDAPGEELNDESMELPERDDSVVTFRKHDAPIFCAALHPTENLAVTGGEDDKAYVWNTETAEVVFTATGHSDSVISAEFSHDGVFVATADMAGEIQVFKTIKEYKRIWNFSMGDLCWMKWHSGAYVLMAGADSGEIYVWKIPSGDCKVLQGRGEKCETASLTADGKRLAAGYGDGSFKLWDLKTGNMLLDVAPNESLGHMDTVTSIACDRENNLILTGSADGKATIIASNGPVGCLVPNAGTIETVLLDCPDFEQKIAVTGTLEGKVTVWDVGRQVPRTDCDDATPVGITKMVWGRDQTIVAGTLNGAIKAWDARSGSLKFSLLGHMDNIHDLVYCKTRNIILSASEDKTAKVFNFQSSI